MFETLGIENLNSSSASFYFALVLGGLFGYSAEKIKFCFRRALINDDRSQALFAWLFALAIADHMTSPVLSDIGAPSDLGNACAPCGAPCKSS